MEKKIKSIKLPIINERFLQSLLKILCTPLLITKRFLSNVEYLFDIIDLKYYSKDVAVYALIQAIKITVKHRQVSDKFSSDDLIGEITSVISESYSEYVNNVIIPTIKIGSTVRNPTEITMKNDIIETSLKYAAIVISKEKMSAALTDITSGSSENLKESITKYRNLIDKMSDEFRKTDSVGNDNIINSSDEEFNDLLMETYDELKNPKYSLKTGLKTFNALLSEEGGFKSSCYYIFYALVNSFKSGILQYCSKWIRKYNGDNYLKMFNETGLIPTVLYYSFENTKTENMQREFYMETGFQLKDVKDKAEVKRLWQEHYNNTGSIINVAYKYAESNTIRVSDMRRQIHALNDSGYKVIAVIVDYLELIRPEDEDINIENRLKLGFISNALHVMSVAEDIVVITAQQMNRAAEAAISDLRNKGQSNLIDQVNGMQYIGESIGIEKPADVSMYAGTERSIYDNELYLTIKRGKCRYRQTPTRYFVQKLINGFYIEDDYGTDKVTSKAAIMPEPDGEIKEMTEIVSSKLSGLRQKKKQTPTQKDEEKTKKEKQEDKPSSATIDLIDVIMNAKDEIAARKSNDDFDCDKDEYFKEFSKFVTESEMDSGTIYDSDYAAVVNF